MVCLGLQMSVLGEQNCEPDVDEFNENDVPSMAQAYYNRDLQRNLNFPDVIINSMKKLQYYGINESQEETKFINKQLALMIKNNQYSKSNIIEELTNEILKTKEYAQFKNRQFNNLNRAMCLSKFVGTPDVFDFYNSLTVEELAYLGY
jgi:hypothetical protein